MKYICNCWTKGDIVMSKIIEKPLYNVMELNASKRISGGRWERIRAIVQIECKKCSRSKHVWIDNNSPDYSDLIENAK